MLEGTIHAREWISAATVTWIIKEFLTSTDPEVRALAENFEWHIFPVVNPDGYVHTFTTVSVTTIMITRITKYFSDEATKNHFVLTDDLNNEVGESSSTTQEVWVQYLVRQKCFQLWWSEN